MNAVLLEMAIFLEDWAAEVSYDLYIAVEVMSTCFEVRPIIEHDHHFMKHWTSIFKIHEWALCSEQTKLKQRFTSTTW